MKFFKKIVRIIILTLVLLLAVAGMPAIFPDYKGEYQHKRVRREAVANDMDEDRP